MKYKWLLILALAALVAILPLALYKGIGFDLRIHQVSIDCFARQFWEGDLYPRWCFTAEAGLGSPLFLFYYPLPYFFTNLLWPLHALGLGLNGVFILALWLVMFGGGVSVRHWLKDDVGEERALLCGVLFMFVPYTMEIIMGRASYPELFCMALAPQLLRAVRDLGRGNNRAALRVTLWTSLMLLSHLPATVGIYICLGFYTLFAAQKRAQAMALIALALVGALVLTAFYSVPGIRLYPYIGNEDMIAQQQRWANDYIDGDPMFREASWFKLFFMIGTAVTLLMLIALSAIAYIKRARVEGASRRREILAWAGAGLLTMPLLFPFSAPVWALINYVAHVGFPWRVQASLTLVLLYLMGAYTRWFTSEKQKKTWKMDLGLLLGFLILLSQTMRVEVSDTSAEKNTLQVMLRWHIVSVAEYKTKWVTDLDAYPPRIEKRIEQAEKAPRVEVKSGQADVDITGWSWRGISFKIVAKSAAIIRVNHHFFPYFHAFSGPNPLTLRPEKGSGLMEISLPAGTHEVSIKPMKTLDLLLGRELNLPPP